MAEPAVHALARLDLRRRRSRRARSAPELDRLLAPEQRALGRQLVPAGRAQALAAGREVLRLQELGHTQLVVAQRRGLVAPPRLWGRRLAGGRPPRGPGSRAARSSSPLITAWAASAHRTSSIPSIPAS